LKAGAWLRRVRFVIVSPGLRHIRRVQADIPLIPLFELGQPPLPFARDAGFADQSPPKFAK